MQNVASRESNGVVDMGGLKFARVRSELTVTGPWADQLGIRHRVKNLLRLIAQSEAKGS